MSLSDVELDPGFRRQIPVKWPEVVSVDPGRLGRDLMVSSELPVFFGVHPRQSDASIQGALALIDDLEALLRDLSGFEVFSWGAGSVEEALHLASHLTQKWKDLRQFSPFQQILFLHAEEEREFLPDYAGQVGWHQLSIAVLRKDLALLKPYQGATILFTNAAVEKIGGALGSVVASARALGCLCGLAQTDLHWLAAGFWPLSLGFDFAVLDLRAWTGCECGLTVLACSLEVEPFLPHPRWRSTESGFAQQIDRVLSIGWSAGPLGQLPLIASVDAALRTLGAEKLKQLSQRAAIHAAYIQKEVSERCSPSLVSSSLHEVWVAAYRQSAQLSGWETRGEMQQIVERLTGR